MKRLLGMIAACIIISVFAGCNKNKTLPNKTDDMASYFYQDGKLGIHGLTWGESNESVNSKLGEVIDEYCITTAEHSQLVPKQVFVFEELNLSMEATVYRFNENDELFRIEYYFIPIEEEQAAVDQMNQIVEKLNASGYDSLDYKYTCGASKALVDYVTLKMFDTPLSVWTDEDGTTLSITIEVLEGKYRLAISLQRKRS